MKAEKTNNPRMHNPDGMYASEARNEDCVTLRDHFAGLAMQGIVTENPTKTTDHIARRSFEIADAMLKQREL